MSDTVIDIFNRWTDVRTLYECGSAPAQPSLVLPPPPSPPPQLNQNYSYTDRMSPAVAAAEADYTVKYDEEEAEDLVAVSIGNNNTKYASKVNCRKKNCGHTVIF